MTRNLPTTMPEVMATLRKEFERSLIGADKYFDTYFANTLGAFDSYPPRNIEKLGEDKYRITLALAGFAKDDLEIVKEGDWLTVKGDQNRKESEGFLHRGIASRAFTTKVQLAPDIEVDGATMENGLLHIELHRVVPESEKPQAIKIK